MIRKFARVLSAILSCESNYF